LDAVATDRMMWTGQQQVMTPVEDEKAFGGESHLSCPVSPLAMTHPVAIPTVEALVPQPGNSSWPSPVGGAQVAAQPFTFGGAPAPTAVCKARVPATVATSSPFAAPAISTDGPDGVEALSGRKARAQGSSAMRVWEYEEDQMLLEAVKRYGKRWRAIARHFPDRTEAMCRNRYTRIYAPHRPEMKGWKPSVNRCNACGMLKKGHSCAAKGNLFVNASTTDADSFAIRDAGASSTICEEVAEELVQAPAVAPVPLPTPIVGSDSLPSPAPAVALEPVPLLTMGSGERIAISDLFHLTTDSPALRSGEAQQPFGAAVIVAEGA